MKHMSSHYESNKSTVRLFQDGVIEEEAGRIENAFSGERSRSIGANEDSVSGSKSICQKDLAGGNSDSDDESESGGGSDIEMK